MNLLIAEDETLTREGLLHGIDFSGLGITAVRQAADGVSALAACENFCPDLLLTDVRMPRMDGIALAAELQRRFPDIGILFMSGYSDKEYLKAAIRLRAVSYIEKPISLEEVRGVLEDAVKEAAKRRQAARSLDLTRKQSRARTALLLTQAGKSGTVPPADLPIGPDKNHFCVTALIRCYPPADPDSEERIMTSLSDLLSASHMKQIHAVRQPFLCILHLFSEREVSERQQQYLADRMSEVLKEGGFRFHLAFGKPCSDPYRLYDSYNTATAILARAFFHREGTWLRFDQAVSHEPFRGLPSFCPEGSFRDLLLRMDVSEIRDFLSDLLSSLTAAGTLLPNQVRELYYRLFQELRQASLAVHLERPASEQDSLWDRIASVSCIQNLHEMLREQAEAFPEAAKRISAVSSPVYLIRGFIAAHLSDPGLSIKAISDEVHLSTSYVCTIFKAETGDTLTHYITELRMAKARELLMDSRNRIAEISGKVGFSDSNYFSKAFKKAYGLSPSEFRDSLSSEHTGAEDPGTRSR